MRKYSHSALKVFQRCQKRWSYLYIDRIVPKVTPKALAEGIELHDALADYSKGTIKDAPEWLYRYNKKWFDDDLDWGILAVEEEMEFYIGDYAVVFKADLIIEVNGEVWIVDHKTTANIPDEWDPYNMSDFQHLLYIRGVEQVLERPVAGFMFNYIRTKPPAQPKLIKDGSRIADVRRVDTDYDTLKGYAEAHGQMGDPDLQERLRILKHSPDKFFQRHWLPINRAAVDKALDDVFDVLEQMAKSEDWNTYPRHVVAAWGGSSSCARCPYQPLCHAELLGINPEPLLLDYTEKPKKGEQDERTS